MVVINNSTLINDAEHMDRCPESDFKDALTDLVLTGRDFIIKLISHITSNLFIKCTIPNMTIIDEKAFIMWSRNNDTYTMITEQYPDLDDDTLTSHLQQKWLELSTSQHKYWRKKSQGGQLDWIQDNLVKRCGTHYKWESGTIMVGKCKTDGLWYIVDNQYRKESLIEGQWPCDNGRDAHQYQVNVKAYWTENGMCIRFNKI